MMVEKSEDTPHTVEDEDSGSGSGSGSDSDSESEGEHAKIEWLATTREKRANAGNRLHSLLQQEDPDDELELLFQEDEDDAGFSDVGDDQSDVQMDSSSDEEDQGPAAGDDLEGEKELQQQAKAEKAKKRKLGGGPMVLKKRVKIDPTIAQAPAPRPKKKSERASWLPTAEEAPTRASGRRSTKIMKEQLHAQMVDREIKRLKQLANMEKAAAAKEAAKKPALTQADRLAEAARVEKANSKSLSRWEEAEQQREEEQRAKLLALKNRTLDGPVITWWSGMGEWVGGKLKHVGKNLVVEEKDKPAPRKKKPAELEAESDAGSVFGASSKPEAVSSKSTDDSANTAKASVDSPALTHESNPPPKASVSAAGGSVQPEGSIEVPSALPIAGVPSESSAPPSDSPTPSIPIAEPPKVVPAAHYNYGPPKSSFLAPPAGLPLFAPPPPLQHKPFYQTSGYPPFNPPPSILDGSAPVPGLGYNIPQQAPLFSPSPAMPFTSKPVPQPPPPPVEPVGPPAIEHAARNYIILENFDELAIKDKVVQTQILFGGRKFAKCPSKSSFPSPQSELTICTEPKDAQVKCVITSQPARYRDPDTGLPYYDVYAYKEIQKLKRGDYKWSKLLGAYVGLGTYHARGVPERFRGALPKAKASPQQ
jgi:vacuolar protein sorting-associated protein 72